MFANVIPQMRMTKTTARLAAAFMQTLDRFRIQTANNDINTACIVKDNLSLTILVRGNPFSVCYAIRLHLNNALERFRDFNRVFHLRDHYSIIHGGMRRFFHKRATSVLWSIHRLNILQFGKPCLSTLIHFNSPISCNSQILNVKISPNEATTEEVSSDTCCPASCKRIQDALST